MLVVMPGTFSRIALICWRTSLFSKPGLMVTSISELLTGSACSSRSALPVLRVTLLTPSRSNSCCSMALAIRSLAFREVPGGAKSPTVKVPSLNSGRKDFPKVELSQSARIVAMTATPITNFLHFTDHLTSGV